MRLLLMLNYNVLPAASHDVVYTGPLHYTVVDHEQYTCRNLPASQLCGAKQTGCFY